MSKLTESEFEALKNAHPSICYDCKHARKPWADSNREEGYVGCANFYLVDHYNFVNKAEEIGFGWVDLKSQIEGDDTGIVTNDQLITLEVKECTSFEERKKW